MQKTKKKHTVCMGMWQNENGFTFIHLFVALTILSLTLPFIAQLIQAAQYQSNYDMLSVQQFFRYMQDEMNEAADFRVKENVAELTLRNGDMASYSAYKNQIRRQVKGVGHEVYLRDTKQVDFNQITAGIQTKIQTMDGKVYEKIIFFNE